MESAKTPVFETVVEPETSLSGHPIFNCVTLLKDGRQVGLTTCGFDPDEVERVKSKLLHGYLHLPAPKDSDH